MAAFKLSKANIIIISFVASVLLIFGLTVYYLFFYEKVPIEHIAKEFCACADEPEVQSSQFEQSKENFQYASGLNECFGAEFSYYDDGLSFEEEEEYVEKIRKEIFETCPDKLEKVFKKGLSDGQ